MTDGQQVSAIRPTELLHVPRVAWVAHDAVRLMPGAWGVLSAPCDAAGRRVGSEPAGSADLRPRAEGVVLVEGHTDCHETFFGVGGGV